MVRQVNHPETNTTVYLIFDKAYPAMSNCYLCFKPGAHPVWAMWLYPGLIHDPEDMGFICEDCFGRAQVEPTGRSVNVRDWTLPGYKLVVSGAGV